MIIPHFLLLVAFYKVLSNIVSFSAGICITISLFIFTTLMCIMSFTETNITNIWFILLITIVQELIAKVILSEIFRYINFRFLTLSPCFKFKL